MYIRWKILNALLPHPRQQVRSPRVKCCWWHEGHQTLQEAEVEAHSASLSR